MGKRQNQISLMILSKYKSLKHLKLSENELLCSGLYKEVFDVYYALGGTLPKVPINYGPWDFSCNDFIIEIDEERHFNRYRLLTLKSKLYENYPFFSIHNYRIYCSMYENACLICANWGKNWKNNSTEKMFVPSDNPGHLEENGSSRWKQRAFYDFLKDVTAKIRNIPVFRLSIYDTYEGYSFNELLDQNNDKVLFDCIDEKFKGLNLSY
jgi:hypothetical protein